MRAFLSALGLVVLSVSPGCGKSDPDKAAAALVARTDMGDRQAIEEIARTFFPDAVSISTAPLKGDDVELTIVVHPNNTAETKTSYDLKAKDSHSINSLTTPLFGTTRTIKNARQRHLARFKLRIMDTALNDNGTPQDFELFAFTVDEKRFDRFLENASATNLMMNNGRRIVHDSAKVDVDRFDDLTFSNKH